MADNVTLNKSSGTYDAASDDIGGVQYQRVKPAIGADGAAADLAFGQAAAASSIPVVGASDVTGAAADAPYAGAETATARTHTSLLKGIKNYVLDLKTQIVLAAGTAIIGKVSIDQVTANANEVVVKSITAGDTKIGNVDVVTLPADPLGANADAIVAAGAVGSISAKLRRATQGLEDLKAGITALPSHAVTNIGTFATQESQIPADNAGFTDGTTKVFPAGHIFDETAGTALTENDVGASRMDSKRAAVYVLEDETTRGQRATVTTRKSQLVEGPTASDSPVAASPVTVGGRASVAVPTAVSADNDVVNAWMDRLGSQIVRSPGEVAGWTYAADYAAAQTNTSLVSAPGAGLCLYVTDFVVTNDATAAITAKLLDGSGGTNKSGTHKIPASGGIVVNLRTPIKLTAATALCLTTVGVSNIAVFVAGYTAP